MNLTRKFKKEEEKSATKGKKKGICRRDENEFGKLPYIRSV